MGIGDVGLAPELGTPAARLVATRAAALLQGLLALDDLWTAQLERAASGEDRSAIEEPETVEALVGEMREWLDRARDPIEQVRLMLNGTDDDTVEQAMSAISASSWAPADLSERLADALPAWEMRGAFIQACDYLLVEGTGEVDLLYTKMEAIRSGEIPPGDFRFPFRCAVYLALCGVGVAATIGLGGAPVYVAMSVASASGLGVLGWEGVGCPKVLPDIGRGRR